MDLTTEDIDGNKMVICHVKNPGVVVKWEGHAYGGKGTTKKKLSPEEILELNLSLPGLMDITKQKASYKPDDNLVGIFCDMAKIVHNEHALSRFHLDETKCGELLFGNTKYRLVKYNDQGEVLENITRTGLIRLLSDATYQEIREFYAQYLTDNRRISNSMLREAIGNSVGHAAYKDNDGEIIVELHPHCIIVSNLAFAEYTSLANKWFSSAHKSPNSFLMETLRIANKVDELGRGKKKLLSECLINGFRSPEITISEAGRFKRWLLRIEFDEANERYRMLQESINQQYRASHDKSLIAYALVLWSNKPFSEIKRYFDAYESRIAAEIISDFKGPVFFWEEKDKIVLHRWVKILIEEGKSSKEFTHYEEMELYRRCLELHNKHYDGLITTTEFRELAHLSNSASDQNLTSRTFKKWKAQGKVKRVKRGTYKFTNTAQIEIEKSLLLKLLKAFKEKDSQT